MLLSVNADDFFPYPLIKINTAKDAPPDIAPKERQCVTSFTASDFDGTMH